MRFGIDMPTDHTLEKWVKQFDVTRERIRQIEAEKHCVNYAIHPVQSISVHSLKMTNDSGHPA